jgi:hypothetical protein
MTDVYFNVIIMRGLIALMSQKTNDVQLKVNLCRFVVRWTDRMSEKDDFSDEGWSQISINCTKLLKDLRGDELDCVFKSVTSAIDHISKVSLKPLTSTLQEDINLSLHSEISDLQPVLILLMNDIYNNLVK